MKARACLLLSTSILTSTGALADEVPAYYGEADCRIAALEPKPAGDFVKWSGKCKDGYADGPGVLEWSAWARGDYRLEATLARGAISGEGTLAYEKGVYTGTFRNGVPHGQGYFKYANGQGLYEGGVVNGERDGACINIYADRSRYEGRWKKGRRHGYGRETFALGGSYEGGWSDDKFHGHGIIVYAGSGRKYEGEFREGRKASDAQLELSPSRQYGLKDEVLLTGTRPVSQGLPAI